VSQRDLANDSIQAAYPLQQYPLRDVWLPVRYYKSITAAGSVSINYSYSGFRRSIAMSVYVCLSVCLSAIISSELRVRSSTNILSLLPMAAARSCSGGVAICHVLPVFFISAHNAGLWVWQPATGGYSYRRMIINDWSLQPRICMWHISVSLLTPTIWHSQLFLCCWNIVFKSINCITVDILSRYIDNSTS